MKKQEIRGMLVDVDKEGSASVSFNDFMEMVTPKVLARDPKVGCTGPEEFRLGSGLGLGSRSVSCSNINQV